MAHRVEDARTEQPVIRRLGEPKRLDEVPLGQAVDAGVVGHPRAEKRCLCGGLEQLTADFVAVRAVQQRGQVGAQELNQRASCVSAAVLAVEVIEHVRRAADACDVGRPDATAARAPRFIVPGRHQPGQRRVAGHWSSPIDASLSFARRRHDRGRPRRTQA